MLAVQMQKRTPAVYHRASQGGRGTIRSKDVVRVLRGNLNVSCVFSLRGRIIGQRAVGAMNRSQLACVDTFQFRPSPERDKVIDELKLALQLAERADDGIAASLIANALIELGALEVGEEPESSGDES
jgi:hypothetical protein